MFLPTLTTSTLFSVETLPLAVTSTSISDGCGIVFDTGINAPCGMLSVSTVVFVIVGDVSAVLLQPDKMALATTRDNNVGLKVMLNLINTIISIEMTNTIYVYCIQAN